MANKLKFKVSYWSDYIWQRLSDFEGCKGALEVLQKVLEGVDNTDGDGQDKEDQPVGSPEA